MTELFTLVNMWWAASFYWFIRGVFNGERMLSYFCLGYCCYMISIIYEVMSKLDTILELLSKTEGIIQ